MGSRTTRRDQLVANAARERQVGDLITMHVPELATADPEFGPAEAMRPQLDIGPRPNRRDDLRGCAGRLVGRGLARSRHAPQE
jgi:hypothetical protein